MLRRTERLGVMALAGALTIGAAQADFFVYPQQGQSADQQKTDEFECYSWAKNQTNFDPMQQPTATSAPPPQTTSSASAGRGAVGGAALGALVGSTSANAGRGAAIGALGGGLIGGMRRSSQEQEQQQQQQQWAEQEAANYQARRNEYNRAYAACLEGRGYTVK